MEIVSEEVVEVEVGYGETIPSTKEKFRTHHFSFTPRVKVKIKLEHGEELDFEELYKIYNKKVSSVVRSSIKKWREAGRI